MNNAPITITVFDDPDKWLRDNLGDLCTDSVVAVVPAGPFKPGEPMEYRDKEDGTSRTRAWGDHIKALQLLCEQIGVSLFVGGIKSPRELTDRGNWDVEVVDAYFQLVYRGEVIYG